MVAMYRNIFLTSCDFLFVVGGCYWLDAAIESILYAIDE